MPNFNVTVGGAQLLSPPDNIVTAQAALPGWGDFTTPLTLWFDLKSTETGTGLIPLISLRGFGAWIEEVVYPTIVHRIPEVLVLETPGALLPYRSSPQTPRFDGWCDLKRAGGQHLYNSLNRLADELKAPTKALSNTAVWVVTGPLRSLPALIAFEESPRMWYQMLEEAFYLWRWLGVTGIIVPDLLEVSLQRTEFDKAAFQLLKFLAKDDIAYAGQGNATSNPQDLPTFFSREQTPTDRSIFPSVLNVVSEFDAEAAWEAEDALAFDAETWLTRSAEFVPFTPQETLPDPTVITVTYGSNQMSYPALCTIADVESVMGEEGVELLTDDGTTSSLVADSIEEASSQVYMYLLNQYTPESIGQSQYVERGTARLAADVLSRRRGNAPLAAYNQRAAEFISILNRVAGGEPLTIPGLVRYESRGLGVHNYRVVDPMMTNDPVREVPQLSTNDHPNQRGLWQQPRYGR